MVDELHLVNGSFLFGISHIPDAVTDTIHKSTGSDICELLFYYIITSALVIPTFLLGFLIFDHEKGHTHIDVSDQFLVNVRAHSRAWVHAKLHSSSW